MLRAISTNFSIITNFGCGQNCWFCIWKNHFLNKIQNKWNYKLLNIFIKKSKKVGKFSISGGGDCLFEYEKHKYFWNYIFQKKKEYGLKLDIHTKQRFYNDKFWNLINKVVISSNNLYEDIDYIKYLSLFTQVRVVIVATEYIKINMIEDFIYHSKKNNFQITIKQLIGYNDNGNYLKLKKYYKNKLFFLDKGDYNLYYMPNNTITNKFLF